MKKLLILSQYFYPEVGAPQTRYMELVKRLNNKSFKVTILTAMPNYPNMEIRPGYKGRFYMKESYGDLVIHRSYIFARRSPSLKLRLLNYFSFVLSALLIGIFKLEQQDIIICESPPLFLGISAFLLKIKLRARLIMNIADLWPEQAEKLGLVTNRFILVITYRLEKFLYDQSELITGQTNGITENIKQRYPYKRVYWLRNGIDIHLYQHSQRNHEALNPLKQTDFILIYAGIIGYAQGLDTIIQSANELKDHDDIKFLLVGSGPEKERLIKLRDQLNLKNVYFKDPIPKNEIPGLVSFAAAGIIPLKKMPFFEGAIPSKIFDIAGSKKPLLLGVEGEAYELFIKQGNCGLFFQPEDSTDLSEKILKLYNDPILGMTLGENGYKFVEKYFNWDNIAEELVKELGSL